MMLDFKGLSARYFSGYSSLFIFMLILTAWIDIPYSWNNIMLNNQGEAIEVALLKTFTRDVLQAFLWTIVLSLIRPRLLNRCLYWFSICIVSLMFFYEAFLLSQNNMLYGYAVLQAIAGTNFNEATEYIDTIKLDNFLPYLLIYIFSILLLWLGNKSQVKSLGAVEKLKNSSFFGLIRSKGGGIVVILIVLSSSVWLFLQNKHRVRSSRESQIILHQSTALDRFGWNTYRFIQEVDRLTIQLKHLSSRSLGNTSIDSTQQLLPDSATIVLIVGETLRRDYMHCYGYPLPNTPNISEMARSGDLILYTDAVSPASFTIGSLTKILSLAINSSSKDWTEYPTLPKAIQELGRDFIWRSNQESHGAYIQPLIALANTATRVERTGYYSDRDSYEILHYDEDLLKLNDVDQKHREKATVYLYHLMGSHQKYVQRYPQKWARFSEKDIPRPDLDEERREDVAQYVNSIYYNDYVVSELIRKFSTTPSLVIYFADHGEMLYDDETNPTYAAHHLTNKTPEVPFIVYVSPSLRVQAPALVERLRGAATRPIMLDVFPNALLGIMGVKSDYTDPKLDFWGDSYDEARPRVVLGASKQESLLYIKK